jgi:hypothetical protein
MFHRKENIHSNLLEIFPWRNVASKAFRSYVRLALMACSCTITASPTGLHALIIKMIPPAANSILTCSLGWLQEEDRQWLIASDSTEILWFSFHAIQMVIIFHSCVLKSYRNGWAWHLNSCDFSIPVFFLSCVPNGAVSLAWESSSPRPSN